MAAAESKSLRRFAILLAVLAAAWLVAWVAVLVAYAGSPQDPALLVGLTLFPAALALLLAWLVLIVLRLALRRPIGVVGWLTVPIVFALVYITPWAKVDSELSFRLAEPGLRQLVLEHDGLAPGEAATVSRMIKSYGIKEVRRTDEATILSMGRVRNWEAGFVYAPTGQLPAPPAWADKHSLEQRASDWWFYRWEGPQAPAVAGTP